MMEDQLYTIANMLPQPAFLLDGQEISWCNAAATALHLQELPVSLLFGQDLALLKPQTPEQQLRLSLNIQGRVYAATVHPWQEQLLVIASPIATAKETLPFADCLRRPLQELLSAAGVLFEALPEERSVRMAGAAAEVNRAIYQLQRLCLHADFGSSLLQEERPAQRRSRCITELLDAFVSSCHSLVQAAGYTLHYTPFPTPVSADIDGSLIERALYQLLANSMAYTPKGGSIRLSLEKLENRLLIHLSDNGEGIPPEVLSSLYCAAPQQTIADPRRGIGIGLPVVKRIAELHGGSLILQSSPNGTCATLCLSLDRAPLSLRSVMVHSDLYGGRNPALVELSAVLPSYLYDPEEIES